MSDCLFCKIAAKQVPANLLFEDDDCLAFEDINPQAPTHVLVIPKMHLADLVAAADHKDLLGHLASVAGMIARERGLSGFRTVINTGAEAGQAVFHLHIHVLGGRKMNWPPG